MGTQVSLRIEVPLIFVSSNMSSLEAHVGFFKFHMKAIFDPYVQCTLYSDLLTKSLLSN